MKLFKFFKKTHKPKRQPSKWISSLDVRSGNIVITDSKSCMDLSYINVNKELNQAATPNLERRRKIF
ncbi:hypothetical protein EPTV-WA-031 [Eptesipox virus]|uniref:Uncharacterized protein n=1 Tax=Eptesipox virus TaxID=1329402 RepID=A0A220T695_9POXV|nr:hypothetical protein CG743_gp031 [Eptesipox virus]ASK51232.1 hypothetical protein EPTV-WA-031 [Eptesipox virus]WAH70990.1 hypothetical protein CG743_gp031 [Eptesipox virus]